MAVHAAVRQILIAQNQAGGIAGRRFELVSLDDEADPVVRRRRVDELAIDPLVAVVLGPADDELRRAVESRGRQFIDIDERDPGGALAAQLASLRPRRP